MNWAGDFAQKHIEPSDSVLDLGCGIMQATMDFIPAYPKTKLQCSSLLGVDVYQPYLDYLKKKGIKTVKHDLTDVPLPFADKSYDVVLLFDILEHLSSEEADALEEEAARIARKKVLVISPSYFRSNEESTVNVYGLGDNELQRHRCHISDKWLKHRCYQVEKKDFKKKKDSHWLAVKKLYLRILHIWDHAGVACLMATYQRKLGHQADILKLGEYAAADIESFYGFNLVPTTKTDDGFQRKVYGSIQSSRIKGLIRGLRRRWRSLRFYWSIRAKAKNYDILHVHSLWFLTFFIPFKKKIFEFHGDDGRIKPTMQSWLRRTASRFFIKIYCHFYKTYVSTPDLLDDVPNSEWLPNPVDPIHFKKREFYTKRSALYMHNWYESGDHARKIAKQLNLSLHIIDRAAPACQWIPYHKMPSFLGDFEFFIDRKEIPSLSKTGLEALHLGLKVVQGWDNKMVKALDPAHKPERVAERTLEIYKERLA